MRLQVKGKNVEVSDAIYDGTKPTQSAGGGGDDDYDE